jgi:1-acyl-sn-glycerol-3-phosphate acyltransferase
MSTLLSWIARLMFGVTGWRIEGDIPPYPNMVVVGAHHTSYWDGLILIFGAFLLKLRVRWLAKHTLFWPPLGWVMRAVGAIPVNRTRSLGIVEQIVSVFNTSDQMLLILSPEGTRRKTPHWKRGFYYIAQKADVPILLVGPDYPRKRVVIGPSFKLSGDVEADLERMRGFFAGITPKFPEQAGEITFGGHHVTPE